MQPDAALPPSSSLLPATGRIHIGRSATSVFDILEQYTPPNGTLGQSGIDSPPPTLSYSLRVQEKGLIPSHPQLCKRCP